MEKSVSVSGMEHGRLTLSFVPQGLNVNNRGWSRAVCRQTEPTESPREAPVPARGEHG
jgi:hypothetical protein